MQVSLETSEGLERKMTVEVPAEEVNSAIEIKLKNLSTQVKMSGFRPGKVPLRVVRQQYGKKVTQEVIAETMQTSFQKAVMQEKLRPAGSPSIDPVSLEVNQNLKYIATFEVYPEVELADASKFEIEVADVEVADSDIDDIVEKLLKQKMKWTEVERKAKQDDQVSMNFVGKIDGEAFEGGSQENFPTVIGSSNLLPDFEKQLTGVVKGDKKSFEVTFPKDYMQQDLAEKVATFEIEVLKIEEGELPELNEELIKEFGIQEGTIEAFRKQLSENMTLELEQRKKAFEKNNVMDCLFEEIKVDIPNALEKQEIEALRGQAMSNMQMPDNSGLPDDVLPDRLFEEEAKKRISLGLIISEIVQKKEIKVDQDKVAQQLQVISAGYGKPDEVIQYYRNNREAMANVEMMVMEEQVVDYVLGEAKKKSKKFSFDEFVNKQT
ncbi:MAG: trigger factor [Gammaproteobacteria bacterium]|nr:MAG: trigger factor [Gammaproteobacteria bacterium]